MAVTLKKKVPVDTAALASELDPQSIPMKIAPAVLAPASQASEAATLIKQLAGLQKAYDEAKLVIKSYEAVRKMLVEGIEADGLPADKNFVQTIANLDETIVCDISARSETREVVNKVALLEALGEKTFVEISSFKLTDIDKYLTEAQKQLVVEKKRTGSRTVKIITTPK